MQFLKRKMQNFLRNETFILQKLLSALPQYTKSDYKISSQNGDSSSTILPRKSFDHFFNFIKSLVYFRSVIALLTLFCSNMVHVA